MSAYPQPASETRTPPVVGELPSAAPSASGREEIEAAMAEIRGWISKQTAHHPRSSDAYDGLIDRLGEKWHRRDEDEHDAYLEDLGRRPAKTDIAIAEATNAHRRALEASRQARNEWEQARIRLGLPLPPLPAVDAAPSTSLPGLRPRPRRRALPAGRVDDPDCDDPYDDSQEASL